MIRELKIIFGLDAVAGQLRVTRQRLVFLMKLGSVAAIAVVLTVTRARRIIRRALSAATAAPAAVLTIVDQTLVPVAGGLFWPLHQPGPSRPLICTTPSAGGRRAAPASSRQDRPKTPKQSGVGDG